MKKLTNLLEWPVRAEDPRQQAKVDHPMKDIIAIVFFATLANAGEWGRDSPVCGIQRETPAQISGTAQRHSVARHDTARVRDGAVRVSTGVSRAVGPDRVRERRGKTPKDTGAGR